MSVSFSNKVSEELSSMLKDSGLVTSFSTLASVRLRKFLKKPVTLLREGWNYDGDSGESRYRLGETNGVHQYISVQRKSGTVTLSTVAPGKGRQEIVWDLRAQEVLNNEVFFQSAQGESRHRLLDQDGRQRVESVH